MKIDVLEIIKSSATNDPFATVNLLTETQQKLLEATLILASILENPEDDLKEYHEKRIKLFLKQFSK